MSDQPDNNDDDAAEQAAYEEARAAVEKAWHAMGCPGAEGDSPWQLLLQKHMKNGALRITGSPDSVRYERFTWPGPHGTEIVVERRPGEPRAEFWKRLDVTIQVLPPNKANPP